MTGVSGRVAEGRSVVKWRGNAVIDGRALGFWRTASAFILHSPSNKPVNLVRRSHVGGWTKALPCALPFWLPLVGPNRSRRFVEPRGFSPSLTAKKKAPERGFLYLAVREGFEPSKPFDLHTFQACSFDHSDTSPDRGAWTCPVEGGKLYTSHLVKAIAKSRFFNLRSVA